MKITRLDKIIQNNISFSSQRKLDEQAVYILQDISETLAMIYDKLQENDGKKTNNYAAVIPFTSLNNYEIMHLEHVDFPQGYAVSFIRYEEYIDDYKRKITRYAIVNAFGQEMRLKESEYNKKWRCWTTEPTEEERNEEKWA